MLPLGFGLLDAERRPHLCVEVDGLVVRGRWPGRVEDRSRSARAGVRQSDRVRVVWNSRDAVIPLASGLRRLHRAGDDTDAEG